MFGGASLLIMGSLAAQAITMLISPVLTRIFTPSDLGVFALYASGIAVLTLVSTARYDFAVVSPRSNGVARVLVDLVTLISLAALIVSITVLLLWVVFISIVGGLPTIRPWVWVMPFGVLLSALQAGYAAYLLRNRRYGSIAAVRVAIAVCSAILSVTLGWLNFGVWGLLLSSLAALFLGVTLSIRIAGLSWWPRSGRRRLLAVARRFMNFPRIDLPASILGVVGTQLPTLLMGAMFGTTFVGYYAIVDRIFLAPLNIIGGAIGSVFRVRATDAALVSGGFRAEFVRTLVTLLVPALLFFLPIMAFGEELFMVVFGSHWGTAGRMAEILCPLYFVRLVASPLSMSLYVRNRMKVDLFGQTLLGLSAFGSMATGWFMSDPWIALKVIVACSSAVYLGYLAYSWRLSSVSYG